MTLLMLKQSFNNKLPSIVTNGIIQHYKHVATTGLFLATVILAPAVQAEGASPAGLWKNIDDVSGKPRALIRITETDGTLQGKIEKVFPAPNEDTNPTCEKCEGSNKNAPIIGLIILTGLKKDGQAYVGGQILDPDNGKLYRSKARLADDGKSLSVRGYIGVPMLGRSQTWQRQE